MKIYKSLLLIISCFIVSITCGSPKEYIIPTTAIITPSYLGTVDVIHRDTGEFLIIHKNILYPVLPSLIDKDICTLSRERLMQLLDHGYILVNQTDTGEFTLLFIG